MNKTPIKSVFQLVIVALPLTLCSQNYIPTIVEGNHWEVRMPLGLGQYRAYQYELLCDTVINDTEYLMLKDQNQSTRGFYREDTVTQEVFYLGIDSTEELLVLSYNWEQGDTIIFPYTQVIVDSVYYGDWFGTERKILWIDGLTQYIEGVGSSWDGIFYDDQFFTGPFMYYHVYDFYQSDQDCSSLTGIEDITATEEFIVYPNPFQDQLCIDWTDTNQETLSIYSMTGKLVLTIQIEDAMTVNSETLPAGVYLIKTAKGIRQKIIKY